MTRTACAFITIVLAGCASDAPPDGAVDKNRNSHPVETTLDLDGWQLAGVDESRTLFSRERAALTASKGDLSMSIPNAASLAALLRSVRGEEDLMAFSSLVERFKLDEGIPASAWRRRMRSWSPILDRGFVPDEDRWQLPARSETEFLGWEAGEVRGKRWKRDWHGCTVRFIIVLGPGRYEITVIDRP